MNIWHLIHCTPLHLCILRAAALFVPGWQRAEWLAEWKTELWYAWQPGSGESDSGRRKEVTSFCLGAFSDAIWLQRNASLPRAYGTLLIDVRQTLPDPPIVGDGLLLQSPVRCLAFLGLLATLSFAIAMLLPTSRSAMFSPLHSDAYSAPLNLVTLFGIAWLIVSATTSLSLGDYPAHRNGGRRWAFFWAKIGLILAIVTFVSLDLASLGAYVQPALIQTALWSGVMALRWALQDQRRRCPVCLRPLENPVRIGQTSHMFLEWSGTELVCLRGHGLLHVPEAHAIWFTRQRWHYLDPSWGELFRHQRL